MTRRWCTAMCTLPVLVLAACQSSASVGRRIASSAAPASPLATAAVPTVSVPPTLVGQPSPLLSPTPAGVPVHLVVSGQLPSTVATATSLTCGRTGGAYAVLLQFDLSGQPYQLDASILDYHGPGTYAIPPERVSLHTVSGARPPHLLAGTSGHISVGADESSGSVDTVLEGDAGETHLGGSFRC